MGWVRFLIRIVLRILTVLMNAAGRRCWGGFWAHWKHISCCIYVNFLRKNDAWVLLIGIEISKLYYLCDDRRPSVEMHSPHNRRTKICATPNLFAYIYLLAKRAREKCEHAPHTHETPVNLFRINFVLPQQQHALTTLYTVGWRQYLYVKRCRPILESFRRVLLQARHKHTSRVRV